MTNDYPSRRRDSLRQAFIEEGLDALLVTQPLNVTYLTGFTGESSYLVLGRDRAVLVSDQRFTEQIMEECPGLDAAIRPPTRRPHDELPDDRGRGRARRPAARPADRARGRRGADAAGGLGRQRGAVQKRLDARSGAP